ncbi:MAG: YhdP family protein [Woeseiaceae bacterium]|nr:YhdP family protein [Woeseiaceae bacterium]
MKNLLKRILRLFAYLAGGIVILLAIAVGLFRLFLPRLPEYQEDIKGWASDAIGMSVEFSGMDARWGLRGPEVEFYDTELITQDTLARIVAADQVSVGVALSNLLFDRKAVVDRVVVRETTLEVRQLANGTWSVQGTPIDQLLPAREVSGDDEEGGLGPIEVRLQDIQVNLLQPGDERPKTFDIPLLVVNRDDVRMTIDASVGLPEGLGEALRISAVQFLDGPPEERSWDVRLDLSDVRLRGISAMQPLEQARFDGGRGDLEVSLEIVGQRVRSATANVDIRNIAIATLTGLALQGRIEFLGDEDGWLVAASEFQPTTPAGEWPVTSIRVETGLNDDGKIAMVDVQASYLNFADAAVAVPWLDDEQTTMLGDFDPSGVVRDLALTLRDLDSDTPRFTVSAEFDNVGVAAAGKRPGVRGFSGRVRADRASGRLEIDSDRLVVTAPGILGEPLAFDTSRGTVIWRRGNDRTTVLSDSIVLRNAFFDSETSVEVSLAEGAKRPFIDLESVFSVSDLAAASTYVPYMEKRPKMSEWFREGIVSGRVPNARARLVGDMKDWPFDNGEGQLLIESNIQDGVIIYEEGWPQVEIIDADLVVENMSLLSERNHAVTVGNVVRDARIEIGDFRNPLFSIRARSESTLPALRELSVNSPINEMLGRQLEKVTVSGNANLDLALDMPVRDAKNFTLTARLEALGGSGSIEGFNAPLTDLTGTVVIERENVFSEALAGTLLGRPVAIELSQAPESMPEYRVIADAAGAATADALKSELGLPLSDRVTGEMAFSARLLFPAGNVEEPMPFTIQIASDLEGLGIRLPRPLGKPADESVDLGMTIFMPKDADRVDTTGSAGDIFSWQAAITRQDGLWDVDRGIVTFGTEATASALPETRGLHLRGTTDYVHIRRWFEMSQESETKFGTMDRVRSIDMRVGNLHVLGQHLVNHRVRLDRSARDWHVEVEGEDVVASTVIPYDFNSGRPIVVDADRLVLPGDETEADVEPVQVDPRTLPPISVRSRETAFGRRFFGAVEADFNRTADGLESGTLVARDETFEIIGNASWVLDESEPAGTRSAITVSLTSTDVKSTMQRLDYAPGIEGDDLSMLLDLSWSGGPSERLLESLDGEVKLRIGPGRLEEVKPGAGRVFGLLSVAALPRRLALDFRDVFGKGFAFDKIQANFTLIDGNTYTCDLSLESPAADIGIVGRAGLVTRDYEQAAVVRANFGNALPVAGALVAGPQVAAALLIFSQIFKKPLQEATEIYYGIHGTFDEPDIESITPEVFALSGAMAGCVPEDDS